MPSKQASARIGRYEVLRELGRGGMSTVYLARQTDLDRLVALKELGGFYASDPASVERFLRESRLAASLSHPNIVTVHEHFEHEGTPYIAMEYMERGSLRPFIASLTLPQAIGVLEQLLSGLAHAESKGIVHRDLKPENVMLTTEGTVKIADFGIAKAIDRTFAGPMLTGTGTLLGTPDYMAPEQALAASIGPWTDLYSLGVIAYEMMVGRVPFHDTTTPMAILLKHVNEEIPPPREVNPSLDPRLAEWLERLLVKDPEGRTRRAADAWEELEEIVIAMLGPRWRRAARLPELPGADAPEPTLEARSDGSANLAVGAPAPPTLAADAPPATNAAAAESQAVAHPPADVTRYAVGARTLPGAFPEPAAGGDAPPPSVVEQGGPAAKSPRRTALIVGLVLLVAAAVAAVLAITLSGGSKGSVGTATAPTQAAAPATTQATTEPAATSPGAQAAAPALPPEDRRGLAVAPGAVLLSDPGGWVAALDPATLKQLRAIPDPASPRALAVSGSKVVLADDETVTVLTADDLAPVSTAKFGPGALLAAGGSTVAAARPTGDTGELCVLASGDLNPCAKLQFEPSGLGVTSDGGRVVVASSGGRIAQYELKGGRLSGESSEIDGSPSGSIVEFRGTAYIPVDDGVAAFDLNSGGVSRTISLGARPASIWVSPSNGNLFAALPEANAVAVVDTLDSGSEPARIVVQRPVAVGGSTGLADVVYAVTSAGRVIRLDALTGEVQESANARALRAPAPRSLTATQINMTEGESAVNATIRLEGGRLPASGLLVRDDAIADGRATVELWQGGIDATASRVSAGGLTVAIRSLPGRLLVQLAARKGAFERLEVRRSANGKAVVLELTEPPPPAASSSPSSSGGSSSSSGGSSSSSSSSSGGSSSGGSSGGSEQPAPSGGGITVG